jgi:hypothetical protein
MRISHVARMRLGIGSRPEYSYCTTATDLEDSPVYDPVGSFLTLAPPVNETVLAMIAR